MNRLWGLTAQCFRCPSLDSVQACAGYKKIPTSVCGIGAMLEPNEMGELVVADIVDDGPAALGGVLEIGDVLHEVDGIDMYKRPSKEVGEFIRGEAGTSIILGVAKKKCGSGTVYIEQVEIIRGEAKIPEGGRTRRKSQPHDKDRLWTSQREEAGIGAALTPNEDTNLEITELVPGGPAETSGQVDVGDVLHEVDGICVLGKGLCEVAPMVRGEPGTTVCIAIAKDGDAEKMLYPVLIRDVASETRNSGKRVVENLASVQGSCFVSMEACVALSDPVIKQRNNYNNCNDVPMVSLHLETFSEAKTPRDEINDENNNYNNSTTSSSTSSDSTVVSLATTPAAMDIVNSICVKILPSTGKDHSVHCP